MVDVSIRYPFPTVMVVVAAAAAAVVVVVVVVVAAAVIVVVVVVSIDWVKAQYHRGVRKCTKC